MKQIKEQKKIEKEQKKLKLAKRRRNSQDLDEFEKKSIIGRIEKIIKEYERNPEDFCFTPHLNGGAYMA